MARQDFRTPRLFLDTGLSAGAELPLDHNRGNYLLNVMRLSSGDAILAFNGRDGEWRGRLAVTGRRAALLRLEEQTRPQTEAGDLVYSFAPLKHARLDYMVQKAAEMGASRLSPVFTQHTQVTRVNVDRMRANVVEAAEQCGALSVPTVDEPQSFDRWLASLVPDRVVVFCDEGTEQSGPLATLAPAPPGPATVLIGPEGGFSDAERSALLNRKNVVQLSLGPRILRADTAAVAALALVQAVRGDWC